jgi:hypothetical protein
MLSGARVPAWPGISASSKHPKNAFSIQVASANSTQAFCILSCWLRGYKKSEQILGRIPCYGMVQGAFSGSFDSPSVSRYAGIPRSRSG